MLVHRFHVNSFEPEGGKRRENVEETTAQMFPESHPQQTYQVPPGS